MKLFSAIVSVLLFTGSLSAQIVWQTTNGPFGPDRINRMTVAPSGDIYLYVDTLLRSVNNGASWTGMSTGGNSYTALLAVSATEFFAGDNSALRHSTDGGATWPQITNLGINPIGVYAVEKNAAGDLFVGTNNHVFRSTNNGSTWNRYTSGLPSNSVYSISFPASQVVLAGTFSGIGRSTNNGVSWSAVSGGPTGQQVPRILSTGTGTCYAIGTNGVFKSVDDGANWTNITSGIPDTNFASGGFDPAGNLIVGASNAGLYRTVNGGATWTSVSSGALFPFATGIASASGNLYAVTAGAFHRSTTNGDTWVVNENSFPRLRGRTVYVHTNNHIFYGSSGGVFRSNDLGANFTSRHIGLPNRAVVTFIVAPNGHLLAGTYYGGVYETTDDGDSWTFLSLANKRAETFVKNNAGVIFTASDDGVYHSSNSGVSWTRDTTGLENHYYVNAVALGLNGDVYACTNFGVYKSTNSGANWTFNFSPTAQGSFYFPGWIVKTPTGTMIIGGGGRGLWRTTNNGGSWSAANTGLGSDTTGTQALGVSSAGNVFVGGKSTVYRSFDDGATWTLASNSWPSTTSLNVRVAAFAFDASGIIFAATDVGLYRSASSTGVESSVASSSFSLDQNYPNPFNPSTTITFSLPQAASARLVIFNTLGQEVATLVNEYLAAGTYRQTWNAKGVSSGVYACRLQAGNLVATRKILLMK